MINEAKIALVHNGEDALHLGDFTAALNRIIFSDIPKDNVKSDEQLKLVAYHEVGHALMGYILQPEDVHYVSIIPQGNAAGKVKMNADDDVVKTKEYYEGLIKIGLAGMLAVRVMTGTMSSGNKSDLEKAVTVAGTMMDEGFYGFENLSVTINKDTYGESRYARDLTESRGAKLMEILNTASADVEKVLQANKELLERLATKLVEKRELSNRELVEMMKGEIVSEK